MRQQNLPESLKGKVFYQPSGQGFEKTVAERLREWWGKQSDNG